MRPFGISFSRMVGRQEFDKAIVYLRSGLKGDASDLSSLEMLAHCHYWAGHSEEAIKSGREALRCDPKSFDMHALLAQLLAERGEHEDAAIHARRGLECYPEPIEVPGFILKLDKALRRVFPTLRGDALEEGLKSMESERASWFDWAKKYLAWYDLTYGDELGPMEH